MLEAETARRRLEDSIQWKSAMLAGFWGDYIEFGAYEGASLCRAHHAYFELYRDFWKGKYNHATATRKKMLGWLNHAWENMRFIAFDSWEGLPEPEGADAEFPHFEGGTYAASLDTFSRRCDEGGVPREKVVPVKGFFADTLTAETARGLNLRVASVVMFDCDLYESTRLALDFVTPYLRDGTVLIFDDWYQFNGHPELGEQKAFTEWLKNNPRFKCTAHAREGPWAKSFIVHLPIEEKPPGQAWLPNPAHLRG